MAVRRPLVLIGGQVQELPAADSLPGGGGGPAAWADITGKPTSTPAAIDTAVTTSALRVSDVVTAVPTEWPVDVRTDGVLFFVES